MMRAFLQSLDAKVDDIVKVNAVGAVAFVVSWSDFDHYLRTAGLILALVYTACKIYQALKEIRK
jgi:hypothetical protein